MDMWVGIYEERLAQQESGAALSNSSSMFPGCYYTRCALEPMEGFTHAVQTEATCL